MLPSKKRPGFDDSQEGILARNELTAMAVSDNYTTKSSYAANTLLYPNNVMSFVDKHMSYLRDHSTVDPRQYVSNLKLMTKIKRSSPVRYNKLSNTR